MEQIRKDKPNQQEQIDLIKPKTNDEYINKIRKRLNEDSAARAEREKRRRKVLVDQLKSHELQEVKLMLNNFFYTSSKLHFKIFKANILTLFCRKQDVKR